MGHYCIDQGADLVIGHHPHVIQGMEIYHGKPICYSLGNFIFDQRYGPATESLFVKVTITKKRIKQLEIVPITIRECLPHLADTESATKIRENFLKYSEPFDLKNTETNRWEL
jgi:poly-gamma-glutamate synthesis protein (capsule biosynthesis protein)